MSETRRGLSVVIALALLHGSLFVVYQRPDWNVEWTDQGGYRMLGHGLAQTGSFTRYPDAPRFVPEAIRTPGYPLFLAAIYRTAGESQVVTAAAQVVLFAVLCVLVFAIASRVLWQRAALAAAIATALYSPLPYFAALVLTELWTTLIVVATILVTWKAVESQQTKWFIAAGFLFGYATLSRPVFVLLAPFMAMLSVCIWWRAHNARAQVLNWAVLLVAYTVTVAPWFLYNYRHFGIINISAAGGIGRPIFESSWQGVWPGRVQAALTDAADTPASDAELAVQVRAIAAEHGLDPNPMLDYVHEWREIRKIWTTPTDPDERFRARIIGDLEYLAVGLANIREDIPGFLTRRVVRGQFVLWAADIPVRHSQINQLPGWVIRMIWLPQIMLCGLALAGIAALIRERRVVALVLLSGPLFYVGAVHFLLLTESRQSLPVKPLMIVLAVLGWTALLKLRRHAPAR